jgi:hypothetical protein
MQVTLPPLKYDHPYDGVVIERVLLLAEARSYCQQIGVGYVDACAGFVTMQDGSRSCLVGLQTPRRLDGKLSGRPPSSGSKPITRLRPRSSL